MKRFRAPGGGPGRETLCLSEAKRFFWYAQHGRHLYGESPEWGLASAYH